MSFLIVWFLFGRYAFDGCTSLNKITIPENVKTIGTSAFGDCAALTEITIPSSVTSVPYAAFENCNPSLIIHVPFKEGEALSSGWSSSWNFGFTGTIDYAK